MSAHENMEHAEHAEHAAHGGNKNIALLISVLALFLAFSETLGKSAQTTAITLNVASNDLWAFFQAKTIRMTVLTTAGEQLQVVSDTTADPAAKATMAKTIDNWKKNAARYNDEPETNEGRKQLAARAKEAEHQRDEALARYHNYEFASAAFQIGIVLASATIITGMMVLAWLAGGLGIAGARPHRLRPLDATRLGFSNPRVALTGVEFRRLRRAAAIGVAPQPHEAAQETSGALRFQQPHQLPDALAHRFGDAMRPKPRPKQPFVHPAKPRHLQQLVARHVEDEGGNAETGQLDENDDGDGAEPVPRRQEIDFEKLQRQHGDEGDGEDEQHRPGRQVFDQTRQLFLDLAPGNQIDDARDDGLEMIPQPGFGQENQREDDPERAKPAAVHGEC